MMRYYCSHRQSVVAVAQGASSVSRGSPSTGQRRESVSRATTTTTTVASGARCSLFLLFGLYSALHTRTRETDEAIVRCPSATATLQPIIVPCYLHTVARR